MPPPRAKLTNLERLRTIVEQNKARSEERKMETGPLSVRPFGQRLPFAKFFLSFPQKLKGAGLRLLDPRVLLGFSLLGLPFLFLSVSLGNEENVRCKKLKYANRAGGRVKMDQGVWSKLPADLLQQVLLFLPLPNLCRFRIVCKRWNNIIRSPEFGQLCVLNANKRANEGAYLVVRSVCQDWTGPPGWSILDLNEKRWYTLKHDLPKAYDYIAAMDGGLVCTFVDSFTEEQRRAPNRIYNPETYQYQTLVMFNLFGRASKVLPNPPLVDVDLHSLSLKLIVENTANTFKIFLLNIFFRQNDHPCVSIYESSTKQWRNPPNPPGSMNHCCDPACIAFFRGLLYVFWASPSKVAVLSNFNFLNSSWEDTGVQFPHVDVEVCKLTCDLVVSDNRLFLVSQRIVREGARERNFGGSGWALDISEIFLVDKESRTVARMKRSKVEKNFSSDKAPAFGFKKSILLMSAKTGKVMLYNLTTGQWELLPQNPLNIPESQCSGPIWKHGTQMNYLRRPDTPWTELAEKKLDTTKRVRKELDNFGFTLLKFEDLSTRLVLHTGY